MSEPAFDEKQIKEMIELQKEVSKSAEELKELVEKQEIELKEVGKTSKTTGEKIGKIEGEVVNLNTLLAEKVELITKSVTEVNGRLEKAEATLLRPDFGKKGEPVKSLGERFIDTDEFKHFQSTRAKRINAPYQFKGIEELRQELKAAAIGAVTSGATSAGALVRPHYLDEIVMLPRRATAIRDLLGGGVTLSDVIHYVEQTGHSAIYTQLTAGILIGDVTLPVASSAGFSVGQDIQIGTGGSAETVAVTAMPTETSVTILYAVTIDHPIGTEVFATRYNPTAETTMKPQSALTLVERTTPVRTLASFIPVSKQVYDDANQLKTLIDNQLLYEMMLSEDDQILWGTGAGTDFLGIMENPLRSTYAMATVPGQTRLDAIRRAMNVSRLAEYPVTGMALFPTDFMEIELLKGTDGHYIWAIATEGNVRRLWGIPVVETTALIAGRALIGAFKMGAAIYDRQQATIDMTDSHEDWFARNMLAVRAEERIALVNMRPASFVDLAF